ncbi:hypothetical protein [Limosilactobacillus difficilis]|uniref:hypothetical protein n=1 Tax=Limosilactobacillus difficilis TaxID=2991838 RepID=UPI0024B8C41F|nr:hypothetical protein [Limosilactobacillus difficilis]
MFNAIFWILLIWLIVNLIWMCTQLSNQKLIKTFAWINVVAVIIGFWVFYGVSHPAGTLATWFLVVNWVNVILAIVQFYLGYRKQSN